MASSEYLHIFFECPDMSLWVSVLQHSGMPVADLTQHTYASAGSAGLQTHGLPFSSSAPSCRRADSYRCLVTDFQQETVDCLLWSRAEWDRNRVILTSPLSSCRCLAAAESSHSSRSCQTANYGPCFHQAEAGPLGSCDIASPLCLLNKGVWLAACKITSNCAHSYVLKCDSSQNIYWILNSTACECKLIWR